MLLLTANSDAQREGLEDPQKLTQVTYFDEHDDAEFETTRPHATPELYRWLLRQKFRRGTRNIARSLDGTSVLTVCGGSGMDAEFLARAGARVIVSDISLGAVERACERSRRFGIALTPVVADVEHLPFRDASVDCVYVHDGLHHLSQPRCGVEEMARVAGRAISVNEPARAAITALAVRLNLALDYEEAGNRVARLSVDEVEEMLKHNGFRIVSAGRYAMYYRHHPGRLVRYLSAPVALPLAKIAFHVANAAIGHFGNKLAVQAVRILPSRERAAHKTPDIMLSETVSSAMKTAMNRRARSRQE
jgi:SAM-dependent methyltransferase